MSRPFECDVCGTSTRAYKLPAGWGTGPWEEDWGFLHACDDPICHEQLRVHEHEYTKAVKEEIAEKQRRSKPPKASVTILKPKYVVPPGEITLESA